MHKQQGFTVLELLVSMGVSALLLPAVASSLVQTVHGTKTTNDKAASLAEIDNVAYWFYRDLSMAEQVLDPVTLSPLATCGTQTLTSLRAQWVDRTLEQQNVQHFVEYFLDPGTTVLKRNYDGLVTVVGRHVTAHAFCRRSDGFVQMDVTANVPGGAATTRKVLVYPNPGT